MLGHFDPACSSPAATSDARTVGLRPRTLPPLHDQTYPLLAPVPHHTSIPVPPSVCRMRCLAGPLRREFVFPSSKRLGLQAKSQEFKSRCGYSTFFLYLFSNFSSYILRRLKTRKLQNIFEVQLVVVRYKPKGDRIFNNKSSIENIL